MTEMYMVLWELPIGTIHLAKEFRDYFSKELKKRSLLGWGKVGQGMCTRWKKQPMEGENLHFKKQFFLRLA